MSEKNRTLTNVWSLIKKIRTSLFSREVLIFLFFVLLSSVLWFLHSLRRTTEIEIIVPIEYTGIPRNVKLTETLPSRLNIRVKDQGANLVAYILHPQKHSVIINLQDKFNNNSPACIHHKELKKNILPYISTSATLLEITPDSIPLVYVKLYGKDVPVRIKGNIQLAQQYMLSKPISINPSHIKIYGEKSLLDKIQYIYTEPLEMSPLVDTVKQIMPLQKESDIKYSISNVAVFIPVEMYTEKVLSIPIKITNIPESIQVKTFPAFAKVTCRVGLSRFNDLKNNNFQISVDYFSLQKNSTGKEKLHVFQTAKGISNLLITPQEVEFIIESKN